MLYHIRFIIKQFHTVSFEKKCTGRHTSSRSVRSKVQTVQRNNVFIVGVGRSGTSLLQSMLHAHPDVAFLPETHFFRRYIARPYSRWEHESNGAEAFQSTLAGDEEYQRADIPVEELLAPFLKDVQPFDLPRVCTHLFQLYRNRKGGNVIGEKDPRLIDYLPQVQHVFPEARILHIVRDPRDVVLSRMKADWSAGRPDWLHALTYRAQIRRGRRQGQQAFGRQYKEVRYEDLLTRPEVTLRDISRHVDVEYSDAMLAFQRSAEELVDESERSWKEETTGPLLRDNTEKWREGLSPWQIRLTEKICGNAFEWFGYKRAEPEIEVSGMQHAMLQLAPVLGTGFEQLYAVACRFR